VFHVDVGVNDGKNHPPGISASVRATPPDRRLGRLPQAMNSKAASRKHARESNPSPMPPPTLLPHWILIDNHCPILCTAARFHCVPPQTGRHSVRSVPYPGSHPASTSSPFHPVSGRRFTTPPNEPVSPCAGAPRQGDADAEFLAYCRSDPHGSAHTMSRIGNRFPPLAIPEPRRPISRPERSFQLF